MNSYAFVNNSDLTVIDLVKKYKDNNKDLGFEYPEDVELITKNDEQNIKQNFDDFLPESFKIMTLKR